MGEIKVNIHLENTLDRLLAREDEKHPVREYDMEAMVDTGAVMLLLPQDIVEQLDLPVQRRATVRYADERRDILDVAGPVTVKILGRAMEANCLVGPPGSEALIAQIQLEQLDLIADCQNGRIYPREDSPYPTLKVK